MRMLIVAGGFLFATAPGNALAHENVGGDELAVANWMLVGAVVTIVMGIIWGVWAARSGQFNNVEESKYTMLETAEDYDAIMAEAERAEIAARAAKERANEASDATTEARTAGHSVRA